MEQNSAENIKTLEGKGLTKRLIFLVCLVLVIISLLVVVAVDAYINYKETIVLQQEKFLMEISKNAARSIEIYVKELQGELVFMTGALEQSNYQELLDDYFKNNQEELYGLLLTDGDNKIIYKTPEELQVKPESIRLTGKSNVGKPFEIYPKDFAVALSQPVEQEGRENNLVMLVKVRGIYENIIKPIKTGVKGYTLVKDSDGIIIMHPLENQIGIDVIDGRRHAYPDFDFLDLEELIERQLRGEEGYALYNSYWWIDEEPYEVQKLNGFAPAYLGDDFWVVATAIDYKELDFPVARTFRNLVIVVLIIVCVFLTTTIMLFKMQRDKQSLASKLKYLEELSAALEDLQNSKQQLDHYQKLKTIGIFTSGIAHEFNNLLTPILGYSEIMLQSLPKDHEHYEDAQAIYESASKAKEIIEQILIFSRRNPRTDKFRYVNINSLIDKSIKLISSFVPQNINVIKKAGVEGYVWCNETQMTQVLINLYTNGCQAMDNGGVLSISLGSEEIEGKGYVNISVSDTGCGIAEHDLEEIFSPFFTTKSSGRGSGLGLSVVQGLVLNHDGTIKVDTRVGAGSTFVISLPLYTNVVEEPEKVHKRFRSDKKRSILIVDDDKRICQMLRKGLIAKGYSVDVYTDSVAVADLFDGTKNKYDFIVTDYSMPQITGIQLARIIKQRYPEKKIILMSGFLDEKLDIFKSENSIDEYFLKPLTPQELYDKIENMDNLDKGDD